MTTLDTRAHHAGPTGMAAPFTITVNNRAGTTSLMAITGDLDMVSAAQLDDALACLSPNSLRTTLDCSGLTFCDSAGLAVLMAAHQHRRAAGGHLEILAPPRILRRLLAISGLDHLVDTAAAGRLAASV